MQPTSERILVVDDEEHMLALFESVLGKEGYVIVCAASGEEALGRLETAEFELVISDLKLPGLDGLELLHTVKARYPGLPSLLLTAHGTVRSAVAAMKEGAYDYLTKPVDIDELKLAVRKALEVQRLTREVERLRAQIVRDRGSVSLVGDSKSIRTLLRQVHLIAGSESTILLQGESGTGKGLVARTIHQLSPRQAQPVITIDCGALPESLLESELFGYVKGAFTGALANKKGLCEEAHRGTLFLDEIGDVTPAFQAKLLRVLQTREIRPVGSTTHIPVDIRVIAATNKDLTQLVAEGRFREDLYYRLAVVPLVIPPLRERRDDIPLLVEHFLARCGQRSGQVRKRVSSATLRRLMDWPWPGNVRELEHAIERAVLLSPGLEIQPESLMLESVTAAASLLFSQQKIDQASALLDSAERDRLSAALRQARNNRARAAKLLGISRSTFYEKLKRYRLSD